MCSLHLTHPSAHTLAVGSRHCGARGAVGGLLPCSRVSLQLWTMPELRFEPTTSDYQSNALSTRPRLPLNFTPSETTWWRSKNRLCMTITWNLSCSPNFCLFVNHKVQSRWGKLGCRVFFQSGAITSTQRWKVTNYIYSRYCNWVAFLCTCTFLSNFFNL